MPEAHQHDWAHHCAAYGACGQPVYFVREEWVHDRYVQHYPHDHRFDHYDRERGYGPERGHDERNHGHDDHGRGHDHDDRGHGHDHDDRGHDHDDHGHDGDHR